MLVDEKYAYILPIMGISNKSLFNGGSFGLGVDDEEVFLRVRGLGHMLRPESYSFSGRLQKEIHWETYANASKQKACYRVLIHISEYSW